MTILWTSVNIFLQLSQCLLNGPLYKVAIVAGMGVCVGSTIGICPNQGFLFLFLFFTSNAAECLTCQLYKAPDVIQFPDELNQTAAMSWLNCSLLSWKRAKFFPPWRRYVFWVHICFPAQQSSASIICDYKIWCTVHKIPSHQESHFKRSNGFMSMEFTVITTYPTIKKQLNSGKI